MKEVIQVVQFDVSAYINVTWNILRQTAFSQQDVPWRKLDLRNVSESEKPFIGYVWLHEENGVAKIYKHNYDSSD